MEPTVSPRGAYGVQVLIAGRQKHWRDEVASQIRRVGYATTTVDCGVDAMTVLALGLPVDLLVTDISLRGELCCAKLAMEARALRPDLRIVYASDPTDGGTREIVEDGEAVAASGARADCVASTVREALAARD